MGRRSTTWPGYFSKLPDKKLAHHYHAASAVLWMVLASLQSWSIHHKRIALHRTCGLATFVLFPFFMMAGIWVIHVEATTLAGDFTSIDGQQIAQFGFFDPLANGAFALLFYLGLKHRRHVQLHGRYMLATLLFVVSPIVFRLMTMFVPSFRPTEMFSYAMASGNIVALLIALHMYRKAPEHGLPFLVAAAFIAAQLITFDTLGRIPAWAPVLASVSRIDLSGVLVGTVLLSLLVVWRGWQAGTRAAV